MIKELWNKLLIKLNIRKPRIKCTVDYKKRYKIKWMGGICTAINCEVCGITYWARNLKSLKEIIEDMSNCEGGKHNVSM